MIPSLMHVRLAAFLAGPALLLTACGPSQPTAPTPAEVAIPVAVTQVTAEQVPLIVEVPAIVRPSARAAIAAQLTGTIERLPWGLGQSVAKGALLVRISSPQTAARLQQAQAQLNEANRAVTRERALVDREVSPPESLRAAEDRLHIAQAAVQEAEALLAHATVIAPFAGVIAAKNVLPGDLATPGQPLLVLEATENLRAEGAIPESLAPRLTLGGTLAVQLEGRAAPLAGTIEELSASADPATRSVLVKVTLPGATARSGQFARLLVPGESAASLSVPATALVRFGQMEQVFVVVDGRASLRLVRTGRSLGDRVEILSGLAATDAVITQPPAGLRDGSPVAAGTVKP